MTERIPQPQGTAWQTWATRLNQYLGRIRSLLEHKGTTESATQDGLLMWDPTGKYPVVSRDGVWKQVVLEDGHAQLNIASNVTAAAPDTAYALNYSVSGHADGISFGSPASRIVFSEAGHYWLAFTAQISSTSSSDVEFYFWPRINGVDNGGTSMRAVLHNNSSTVVISRSALFQMSAGDYLEVMWAVTSTSGSLEAHAATAFAPSSPASTLAIMRVHA